MSRKTLFQTGRDIKYGLKNNLETASELQGSPCSLKCLALADFHPFKKSCKLLNKVNG